MKMKIFGNIIRAARGVRNCLCGGAAKALVVTTAVMFACTAWAAEQTVDGVKYTYTVSGGKATITDVDVGSEDFVEIPAYLGGYSVTAIGSMAFDSQYMDFVNIPEGVTSIGNAAFNGCDELTEVRIPDSLTTIDKFAFLDCSRLEGITLPDGLQSIGERAFEGCWALESIALPSGLMTLGDGVFSGCLALESVNLPAKFLAADVITKYFTSVGYTDPPTDLEILSSAVSGGLTWHFKIVDGGAELCWDDENDEPTIPSTTSVAVVIPAALGGLPVVSIGEEAFMDCDKVPSVTIPATVTSIGEWAFSDCSSLALTVPDTVTTIGDAAFKGCDAMADANGFVIVRGVLHHYTDKDDHVTIPAGVTRIGSSAFAECDLESVKIPSSVKSIGDVAFRECEYLEAIEIPASVTSIGTGAFLGCESLADGDGFVIVRNVLYCYVGDAATVTIPGGVTAVDIYAFQDDDDVKKVTIPASVTRIAYAAFAQCDHLTEVTIPKSVTGIEQYAFRDIGKTWKVFLKTVHVEAGDTGRVRNLLINSGHDVAGITFVEDVPGACVVTFNANGGSVVPATRRVTRGAALGILPEPVRNGFSFDGWFTAPTGGAAVTSGSLVTAATTYYAHWTEIVADVPAPVTPAPVTPAATPACYTFLDAGAITAPYAAGKTLYGALYDGCNVGGVVELKLGKVNPRKGTSRVSGSVTLLDGKRRTIKGLAAAVGAAAPLTVSLEVMKVGTMSITIGGDQFAGTLGKWHVQTAKVGGNWNSPPTVSVNAGDLSVFPGTVLDTLLPSAEKGASSGLKWTFAKATSVKWAKPKAGEAPVTLDAASGKGLIVDTSKDRTNLSGVRLTYTAKKGTFKGSFKVYALEGSGAATKLKKYSLQVGGVVVNGVGYGSATCRKPAVNWAVTVE